MKKVVVVVRVVAGLHDKQVTFVGGDLEAIDRSASTTDYNKLVIVENVVVKPSSGASSYTKKRTIAVFREWVYWKEIIN